MKKNILTLCMFFSLLTTHAQDSASVSGTRFLGTKWKNGFIGVMIGTYSETPYRQRPGSNTGTSLMKPNQQLLPYNTENLNTYQYNSMSGVFFNPYISFHPWSKKNNLFNKQQELRLGMLYYTNSGTEADSYNAYNGSDGGDTTIVSYVSFQNNRQDLGVNIGYTVTSDVFWRRFSLYTGVDLGVTYSVVHDVVQRIMETSYDSVKTYYSSSSDYYYKTLNSTTEYKELEGLSSLSMRGNALFGLNFRIVKPVVLFVEARLGSVYFQPIKGVASLNTLASANIGFKFAF